MSDETKTTAPETTPNTRQPKPGIVTLNTLKNDGCITFTNGQVFITIAKCAADGTVLSLTDVNATALTGLTEAAISVFVNANDSGAKEAAKIRAAIKTLRDGGLTTLADTAQEAYDNKYGSGASK